MNSEFDLISKHFASLSQQIGDDCAILTLKEGEQLATSVDTLVEGVHFHADAPPDQVGYRAVVTALSDLAAMGAEPRAVTLALTLPAANEAWIGEFVRGLEQATRAYDVELIGGDTTRGDLTITVTVMGAVKNEQMLKRDGAKPGDLVFVSGPTGDAAAALSVMNGEWPGHRQYREYLLGRFYRPIARVELGRQLLGIASSAIDISDGLLADAEHICEMSGVRINIHSRQLPLSPALESVPDDKQAKIWALTGGDDYELLFTAPPGLIDRVPATCTAIGEVTEGNSVSCDLLVETGGYEHFVAPVMASKEGSQRNAAQAEPAPPYLVRPLRSLTLFLAFGFGSGLSPKAPGTVGTLVAIPIYLLLSELGLPLYTAFVFIVSLFGIWLCGKASRELKVHDHPAIVWDEFAGFWITMWALPATWFTVLFGFAVFRLFDILKPWPIRFYDRNLKGGLGIMLDDIIAGVFACAVVHGVLFVSGAG